MKIFKILSCIVLSLLTFSCESDDDNATALTNASLAGTYNLTAFNGSGTETDTFSGSTETSTFTLLGSDFNNCTFTFTEAGAITTSGTFTTTTDYTENGMTYTEVEITDIGLDGTYTISGNSLLVSDSDGAVITVNNFSNTGLELFVQESGADADYTFEAEGTYTLVRQ